MGSTVNLSTVDRRPMNAVYRDGSVWTAHSISVSGRAAVRWYELNTSTVSTAQVGPVSDPVLHYFMPGIDVNSTNQMVVGFTGSGSTQFAGAYITGRVPSDPLGQTGPPLQYKAGEAPYTQLTSSGTNRWGDYSLTSIDPDDDRTFWTIQQYARSGNTWVTRIASAELTDCDVTLYCSAKISSNLCVPVIGSSGIPSASNPSGFTIDTTTMERNSNSITFFGVSGPAATPFQGGFLCVGGSVFRLPLKNTGLVPDCTGAISYTLADLMAHPSGGGMVNVGTQVNAQTWGRDPGDPFTTSLSAGVQFDVCP